MLSFFKAMEECAAILGLEASLIDVDTVMMLAGSPASSVGAPWVPNSLGC